MESILRRDFKLLREFIFGIDLGRATDREPGNTKVGEETLEAPPLDELDDPEVDSGA